VVGPTKSADDAFSLSLSLFLLLQSEAGVTSDCVSQATGIYLASKDTELHLWYTAHVNPSNAERNESERTASVWGLVQVRGKGLSVGFVRKEKLSKRGKKLTAVLASLIRLRWNLVKNSANDTLDMDLLPSC